MTGLPSDVAIAQQAARRVDQLRARESQLATGNADQVGPARQRLSAIDDELEQRAARTGRLAELAPANYLLTALGPRPGPLAERARWRQAAWRIEEAREATGHVDPHQALGAQPDDLRAREAWRDAQREIERYRRGPELTPERHAEATPGRELA